MGSITTTINDYALGLAGGTGEGQHAKLGLSLGYSGRTAVVLSFASTAAAKAALIGGEGLEAVCSALAAGCRQVHYVPVAPTTFGSPTAAAVVQLGTGTGTVSVSAGPIEQITAECVIAGGGLGTAKFRFRRGSGDWSATITSAAGWGTDGFLVPDTFTRLVFSAGTGYDVGDTFTISTVGVIAQTVDAGASTGSIGSQSSSPVDFFYRPAVEILAAGALGTATFRYSLDCYDPSTAEYDAKQWSGSIVTPGGGKYAIPNSGLYLTLVGPFTADDIYYWTSTGPSAATSDYITALDVLRADRTKDWEFVHLVGATSNSAAAASRTASLQTEADDAASSDRLFKRVIIECPTSESDSTVASAFASTEAKRVAVCAGDAKQTSAASRIITRRNIAHAFTGRLGSIRPGRDAGWGRLGALPGVVELYRDETSAATRLGAARLVTAGTRPGKGKRAFVGGPDKDSGARTMADSASDFRWLTNARVIDRATEALITSEQPWENEDVRVDQKTGYIDDRDADRFDAEMTAAVLAVVEKDVSAVEVKVDRTTNLLSTEIAPVKLRVTPRGYLRAIENDVGLKNPAFGAGA